MLVGHSLGADAVMGMAQELNAQGVPVALVVPVDGTGSSLAPRNVACVINLTQRSYAYMRPGVGFHGVLDNVDFSGDPGIDHLTIDKSPRVQAEALRYVLETAHDESVPARRRRPDRGATRSAKGNAQTNAQGNAEANADGEARGAKSCDADQDRLPGAAARRRRLTVTADAIIPHRADRRCRSKSHIRLSQLLYNKIEAQSGSTAVTTRIAGMREGGCP